MKDKIVNLKKVKRNVVVRLTMMFIGGIITLIGAVGMIVSVPLIFIIVGIFTMIGSGGIGVVGVGLIMSSIHKWEKVTCPHCKDIKIQITGVILAKGSYKCKRCKKIVLVK